MSNIQSVINSDNSITITVQKTHTPLFGLPLDSIEALPRTFHHDWFVSAGLVDKMGYQFRTISFEQPSNFVKRVIEALETIRDYVTKQRECASLETQMQQLTLAFKKQEKQLQVFTDKKARKPQTAPTQDKHEVIDGAVVGRTVTSLFPVTHTADLELYNAMVRTSTEAAGLQDDNGRKLLKSTFTAYFLAAEGVVKVDTEYKNV